MSVFNDRVNEIFDKAVYLQLMGSFVPSTDFRQIKEIVTSTYDFLKNASENEDKDKLSEIDIKLEEMSRLFISRFPLRKDIRTIAKTWNDLFKEQTDVFGSGITYGWLEELMDLKNFRPYEYVPYQFRIGLAAHKGFFGIEEEFLLKDAFNALTKAEYYYEMLLGYGRKQEMEQEKLGRKEFDRITYQRITELKYEVSAFSRLTIISFYAFIESFVNSIGFSYLQRNLANLNEEEKEILHGLRKGRFLQLKSKIERYQKIIRVDKKAIIITSDEGQIKEPFLTFFSSYEGLRNSAVHYSPIKDKIWLKPQDWLAKARDFSKLSLEVGLKFWNACYSGYGNPEYLGKLDYDLHYKLAIERLHNIESIKNNLIAEK